MELQSPLRSSVRAKRLWKLLKIVLSVVGKGLASKAKLLLDLDPENRGRHSKNLLRNSVTGGFISRSSVAGSLGVIEYEFSCNNSPNPVFFHAPNCKKSRSFSFRSCLSLPEVFEGDLKPYYGPKSIVPVPDTPEYLFTFHLDASFNQPWYDRRNGLLSPCAVRVSDYLSVNDEDIEGDGRVDHDAEEFIRRFYEQLLVQSPIKVGC
ncbi:hypothetical protein SAY86_019703 [Trapa natans]|uniref:Uncharacterized protein n=1 Tax=Trapa natans TaxID=22666 RepID=A0AAN7LPD4_TRANT|nr:hypothetical protein SAY86_019703 [Trapa natans]